jgi:hypothetical protein
METTGTNKDETEMEDSNGYQPPTKLIVNAMSQLATENALGYANGPIATLERMFQDRLCELLNQATVQSGWSWQREIRYRTNSLRNKKAIAVDILGQDLDGKHSAAIELKYVPTNQNGNHAPNPLAFPYDLLKDCLKIELLSTQRTTPVKPELTKTPTFGYSIGLTNVDRILDGTMKGWSRNYLLALCAEQAKESVNFTIGPCIIESLPQATLEGVIYTNKRHHISLGAAWNGKWSKFGNKGFHFIMMSTDFRDKQVEYSHDLDDSHYIPFLREDVRAHAQRRTAEIKKMRSGPS